MIEPLFLQSVCKDYLWGGQRLKRDFGKQSEADCIAESWELSCHEDGDALVAGMGDMTLSQYLAFYGAKQVLGSNCPTAEQLPLIKLIDAKEPLSIQVHPDDAYARKQGFLTGKTEMWYVLDAEPDAALVYGVNRDVTREELETAIAEGTLEQLLKYVPVKAGDVFFIPAGTLHAIGGGILIAEVQQNSNLTYRVYDYDRVDADGQKRPLHVADALAVIHTQPMPDTLAESDFSAEEKPWGSRQMLSICPYFVTACYDVQTVLELIVYADSFCHLLILDGKGELLTENGGRYALKKGDSVLLPADMGRYQIRGRVKFLQTHCPKA